MKFPNTTTKISYLFITLLIFISSFGSKAQNYYVTASTAPYVELSGATSLNKGLTWDDPDFGIPLGFDFTVDGVVFDSVSTYLWVGGAVFAVQNQSTDQYGFMPMINDIIDRSYDIDADTPGTIGSISEISYKTEGSMGNRICKIQWKNVGFFNEYTVNQISNDFTNFQLWFYESDMAIEYRYGLSSVSFPNYTYEGKTGPQIGYVLLDTSNFTGDLYALSGPPSAPQISLNAITISPPNINGDIPNGTVYRFQEVPQKIMESSSEHRVHIFPNPTSSFLNIREIPMESIRSIEIWNAIGQKLQSKPLELHVDVSNLAPGIYVLQITTDERVYTERVEVI